MNKINKIKDLGQVFTLDEQVTFMLSLRKNEGRILEPTAGDGSFYNKLNDCVGIELDASICPPGCLNIDFFDYPITEKFPTVLGNPPYVKGKRILPETRRKLTSSIIPAKNNLYLHVIEKAFHHLEPHGEIIFINPMDFLNSFGSEKLIDLLLASGTITDFYDVSGHRIFRNANPDSCCIWRYEKDNFSRQVRTSDGVKNLITHRGKVFITNNEYTIPFSDLFYVKVGGVAGQGDKFFDPNGRQFVYSKTRTTGATRGMNYQPRSWIRDLPNQSDRDNPRIYVNCKTLTKDPFFIHPCKDWDGSVLAIFPRDTSIDLNEAVAMFNSVDWSDIGFMWHGKFVFTSGGLTKCLLPPSFEKFYPQSLIEF